MRNALFWISLPFLLPQALWVRRRAVRFRDADGPRSGSAGSGEVLSLLAIGDSIIAGVGAGRMENALVGRTAVELAGRLDRCVQWRAFARTGINSGGVLERLLPLPDMTTADVCLISVGVNDVTSLTSLRQWERNLTLLVESLSSAQPAVLIAFVGLPPMHIFPALPQPLRALIGMRARTMDERLRLICRRYSRTLHIPVEFEPGPGRFSGDGYHPSEESYAIFGEAVAERIADVLMKKRDTLAQSEETKPTTRRAEQESAG